MRGQTAEVVFMGSPEFAVPTLVSLINAEDLDVTTVVSQPDRPRGRGKKLAPTPVKQTALSHGVPTLEMSKKDYREVADQLIGMSPDFIVVAAFGLILQGDLLELPPRGCVNLHPSILPRYRGVSPVQAAILAGDRETGCSTMLMDAGVDTGDVLLTRTIDIADDDTAGSLEEKLAHLGALLMLETLRGIVSGTVHPRKQNDADASYTKKIKKEHGAVDWTDGTEHIRRQIRAMNPWPAAYTSLGARRLIILEAGAISAPHGESARPGEVVSLQPFAVATGDGAIELVTVKVEGKKEMPAAELLRGHRVQIGDRLG